MGLHEIKRTKRTTLCAKMDAVPSSTKGGLVNEQEDAFARVTNLMRDLEKLLIEIKEAVIPILVGTGEPTQAARSARNFLRLADRMLEDMNDLLRSV